MTLCSFASTSIGTNCKKTRLVSTSTMCFLMIRSSQAFPLPHLQTCQRVEEVCGHSGEPAPSPATLAQIYIYTTSEHLQHLVQACWAHLQRRWVCRTQVQEMSSHSSYLGHLQGVLPIPVFHHHLLHWLRSEDNL